MLNRPQWYLTYNFFLIFLLQSIRLWALRWVFLPNFGCAKFSATKICKVSAQVFRVFTTNRYRYELFATYKTSWTIILQKLQSNSKKHTMHVSMKTKKTSQNSIIKIWTKGRMRQKNTQPKHDKRYCCVSVAQNNVHSKNQAQNTVQSFYVECEIEYVR